MAKWKVIASEISMEASELYSTMVKQVKEVSFAEHDQITSLYLKYYAGSSAQQVEADLANKSEIILLFHDQQIVGFTTLEIYSNQWQGQTIQVAFSGDTIIHRNHWGRQNLTFACISRMGWYKRQRPEQPMYWFLIVKGHRTYKYMPVFVKSFYPHWDYESAPLKALAESLALEKFGKVYNPQTGILEFPVSQGHLKQAYAYPNNRELNKPSVQYFLQRNPGYTRGHELVCLCELSTDNLKPLTRRLFEKDSL